MPAMLSRDEFKAACPPHRLKDLEPLVKALKGDEDKIRATIEQWWDEPEKVEPVWEDVNKKGTKKNSSNVASTSTRTQANSSMNRGTGRGSGGSYQHASRGGGGRGFSRDRGMGGGRGDRRPRESSSNDKGKFGRPSSIERPPVGEVYSSTAVGSGNRPKSAWSGESKLTEKQPDPDVSFPSHDSAFVPMEESTFKPPVSDVGGMDLMPQQSPPVAPPRPTTRNVWATKGSAHLIEAEKPKPPVAHILMPMPRQPQPILQNSASQNGKKEPSLHTRKPQQQLVSEDLLSSPVNPAGPGAISPDTTDTAVSGTGIGTGGHNLVSAISPPSHSMGKDLENLLPANGNSSSVGNAWKSDVGLLSPHSPVSHLAAASVAILPEVAQPQQSIPTVDIGLTEVEEPVVVPIANEVEQEVSVNSALFSTQEKQTVTEQSTKSSAPTVSSALPAGILNMGKWDVPEADDAGLDFGFGSFGHESDQPEATDEEEIPQPQIETTISSLQQPSSQHQPEQMTQQPESLPSASTVNMSVSPARPPPGLSITGMPPMPANAILVHELENKLDFKEPSSQTKKVEIEDVIPTSVVSVPSTVSQPPTSSNIPTSSLSSDKTTSVNPVDLSQQQPHLVSNYPEAATNPVLPGMSQYTAVYGMGMYNYNPSSLGNFVGVHNPNGPVLAAGGVAGVLPQQQKVSQNTTSQQQHQQHQQQHQQQQTSAQPNLPSQHHQQHQGVGLYGAPSASVNVGVATNEATSGASSSDASNSATGGLPPGIAHGAIPYNPALYHGQQQYYQMAGQPHGGVGYGYGYGAQYGGAVQGGFGYQQVMGQNSAYGQPYDDTQQLHSTQGSHHSSNSYQKSGHGGSGGYRGSRSHHGSHHTNHGNAHQYQNQYNPQQAYAAAQPYMAYSVDHFSQQRGTGYGPSIDPYSMQQGSAYQSNAHTSAGGYSSQEDADQLQQLHKSGKPRQQTTQQQSYGLQGSVSESSNANANNAGGGGWTNPRWVAANNWQGN